MAAATFIVPEDTLLGRDQMLEEQFNLQKIKFNEPLDALQWLAQRRLVKNSILCEPCGIQKSFVKKNNSVDKYCWKCKRCTRQSSVRAASFFSKSHLSLNSLVAMIYCWAKDFSQNDILNEADIAADSRHTVIDWCSFCRYK